MADDLENRIDKLESEGPGGDLNLVIVYENSVRTEDDVLQRFPSTAKFPDDFELSDTSPNSDGSMTIIWREKKRD